MELLRETKFELFKQNNFIKKEKEKILNIVFKQPSPSPQKIKEPSGRLKFPKLPELPYYHFNKNKKRKRKSYLFGEYVNPVVVNPFELFKKEKKKTKLNFGF